MKYSNVAFDQIWIDDMWLPSSFLSKGMLNRHILIAVVTIGEILIGTHLIPESVGSPILYCSPDTLQSFLKAHYRISFSLFAGLSSRIQLCLGKNIIPEGSDKNWFIVFPCSPQFKNNVILWSFVLFNNSFHHSKIFIARSYVLKETGIISNRFWL